MFCGTYAALVRHLGAATFAYYKLKSENLRHQQVPQNREVPQRLSLKNKGCGTAAPPSLYRGGFGAARPL